MEKTSSIFIFLVEREKWGQVEQKIWGGFYPVISDTSKKPHNVLAKRRRLYRRPSERSERLERYVRCWMHAQNSCDKKDK